MMRAISKLTGGGSSCVIGAALTTTTLTTISTRLMIIAAPTCFLFAFIAVIPSFRLNGSYTMIILFEEHLPFFSNIRETRSPRSWLQLTGQV